jgi:AcrR family transcriptional regulator
LGDAKVAMKKDQVRSRVLQAVISAEVSKGHLKWKVSDIARFTEVSRPLIYYHFGKTKKAILTECLNVIAEDYYSLSTERAESLKSESVLEALLESLARTRKMFVKNPSLVVFYQRARMQDSDVCRQLVAIEKRYQQKLMKTFPKMSEEQVVGLHALFHGMITAPFLDAKGLAAALGLVRLEAASEAKNDKRSAQELS